MVQKCAKLKRRTRKSIHLLRCISGDGVAIGTLDKIKKEKQNIIEIRQSSKLRKTGEYHQNQQANGTKPTVFATGL